MKTLGLQSSSNLKLGALCMTLLFMVSTYTTYTTLFQNLLPPGIGDMIKRVAVLGTTLVVLTILIFKARRLMWGAFRLQTYWPLAIWAFYLLWSGLLHGTRYHLQTGLVLPFFIAALIEIVELLDHLAHSRVNAIRSFMWGLSITALTVAAVVIGLYVHPINVGTFALGQFDAYIGSTDTHVMRGTGIWANPNQPGQILWMGIAAIMAILLSGNGGKQRVPLIVAGLVVTAAMVLTGSRTSMLCLVVFSVTYLILMRRFTLLLSLGIIVMATVVPLLQNEDIFNAVNRYFRVDAGLNSRDKIWMEGLVSWQEGEKNSLLGWGLGQWQEVTGATIEQAVGGGVGSHNMYLRTLFETGYVGATSFLLVFLVVMSRLLSFLRNGREGMENYEFVAAFMAGTLVQGMFTALLLGGTTHANIALTLIVILGLRCTTYSRHGIVRQEIT